MSKNVMIVLADGFEEIEAVTPIDVLRRAGLNVTTVGITGKIVTGAHGITLTADKTWAEAEPMTPDVLVLPGGMPGSKNLGEHPGLKKKAEQITAANGWLAAICAAPAFTLASWGLLAQRQATCYPGCETLFPADVRYKNEPIVVDGRVVTGKGPGVALDFSLQLVELLVDAATADNLQSQMQYTCPNR